MNFKQATCAVVLALGSVLGVALSEAQQPGKMTRGGFLGTGPAPTPATPYAPLREFRQGLDELGYVDGRDVVIETRWAGGRIDGVIATGTITAANLTGPLADHPLADLVALMRSGGAYTNVHTNDGDAVLNEGPGDFPGGEVRGDIKENGPGA